MKKVLSDCSRYNNMIGVEIIHEARDGQTLMLIGKRLSSIEEENKRAYMEI